MIDRNPPIPWGAIVRGVAIVYGSTFVSELVFAFTGITPQTDHVAYPLLALLTGAVGVAIALRVTDTKRISYLVAIGVGVWVLSLTSVWLGAQTLTDWAYSSAFIATTVILGRLLLGISLDTVRTPTMPYTILLQQKSRPPAETRRAR
jgi:hypothetical protein